MKRFTLLQLLICCVLSVAVTGALAVFLQAMGWQRSASNALTRLVSRPNAQDMDFARKAEEANKKIIDRRNLALSPEQQIQIMKLYHQLNIWHDGMWWLGIPIQKNPCDMWMMQQIIYEIRPDYIIEAGTFRGGSALFFAQMLEGAGLENSKVLTIDIEEQCQEAAQHPLWRKKVEFFLGSSTDPKIVDRLRERVKGKKVIVDLDSDHHASHVLQELKSYADVVSPGSYLVVEDTNIDGVPVIPGTGPGPMAAVLEFLNTEQGRAFIQDVSREALVLTFQPGGWLKKKSGIGADL